MDCKKGVGGIGEDVQPGTAPTHFYALVLYVMQYSTPQVIPAVCYTLTR